MTLESPLRRLQDSYMSALSDKIAGGQRQDHREFLPEVDLPDEGLVPEEFLPLVHQYGFDDAVMLWRADPTNPETLDGLNIVPASGPGQDGEGGDWFRGGEAPSNHANRHSPLYVARKDFAVDIHDDLEEMFGVSAQGSAGHYRTPHASHAAAGGPSANSDHYSGGAIDFFGDTESLQALRDYLVTQPYVSFVRWQSESHWDHVHASFDLGWIKENYFQTRQVPPVSRVPSLGQTAGDATRAATSTRRSPEEATRTITGGGVQAV